jgi:hypothetical protein
MQYIVIIHYHIIVCCRRPGCYKERLYVIQKILLKLDVEPCMMYVWSSVRIGVAQKMRFWDQSGWEFLKMIHDYKNMPSLI